MAYIWNPNTAGLLSSFDIQDKQNSTSMIKEGMFFLLCKKSQSAIESKSISYALKILNKIMGHCNLNSTRNVYSGCFSTPTHMEESDIDKQAIDNKDTSNSLEITFVQNLITLTYRNATNGSFVRDAMDLASKLVLGYLLNVKVSMNHIYWFPNQIGIFNTPENCHFIN